MIDPRETNVSPQKPMSRLRRGLDPVVVGALAVWVMDEPPEAWGRTGVMRDRLMRPPDASRTNRANGRIPSGLPVDVE
ncbi:hypothetical protein GCM10009657_19420 [Oryzihumus leptocrescens]